MRIIILLGPPGSGKGTLAQMCENDKFAVIGAGNLLRERASKEDSFALELRNILNNGHMVDNDIILKIVLDKLDKYSKKDHLTGVLLDGYPRNVIQMESLYNYLKQSRPEMINKFLVFSIIADDQLLYDRINRRFICSNAQCGKINSDVKICSFCRCAVIRRSDDISSAVIKTRLDVFKNSIESLNSFFSQQKIAVCNFKIDEFVTKEQMFDAFNKFVNFGK